MIEFDTRELRRLEDQLRELNAKGIHFAERNTINDQAFATQQEARRTIRAEFTNRNRWTERSVQVDKARSLRDSAEVGSTERYMEQQEFGDTKTHSTHIATPAASGESPRARTRRRPVRRANRMTSLKLGNRPRGMSSQRQANIVAVKEAKESGRKFVFLQRGQDRGIYKVFGTKRKPKTRKIQDMSRKVAVIPKNPWLMPSTNTIVAATPRFYFKHLQQQLDRMR